MAFQFQINRDIEFNHNETLLKKSKQNQPELLHTTKAVQSLGKLVEDKTKLEGWTIEPESMILENREYKKDDLFILDFGNHNVGRFSIDIDSVGSPMDSPLYLRIRFAEVPAELSHQSSEYDGWLARGWIQEEFIHIDELPATLNLERRYAFRYVEIKIIDTSPKWSAVFSNAKITTESSINPNSFNFPHIEDEMLKKIYEVGVKTLQDCMTDVFEDGPKRDRRLWLGDLRLQALANYATFDQTNIVKRCLYLFGAMTTKDGRISANVFVKPKEVPDDSFLFDYSLFFISTLYDYIERHFDQELLEDLFPIAQKQIDLSLQYVNKEGRLILDEAYPVFVDWSNDFNKDTCAQAIMIYTLRQFISLCKTMNTNSEKYEKMLNQMIQYTIDALYDQKKNLFKTTNDEYNIASQVWMVLAKVLDLDTSKTIMESMLNQLFPVKNIATPYMYHHIAEALFSVDLKQEAIDFMKGYWGKMIDLGADTFWEAFDPDKPDYSPYGSPIISSYCHAWSCTPVYLIQKYLL